MFIESGYFTIERNILSLTPRKMELVLGFRRGRLTHGARIVALDREPRIDEFEPRGSTLFPDGIGLDRAGLHASKFIPGAWLGERLVKVEPILPHNAFEWYPPSPTAVEQWKLVKPISGHEICTLSADQPYWGR